MSENVVLTGDEAFAYAEANELPLRFTHPIDGPTDDLTVEEARALSAERPGRVSIAIGGTNLIAALGEAQRQATRAGRDVFVWRAAAVGGGRRWRTSETEPPAGSFFYTVEPSGVLPESADDEGRLLYGLLDGSTVRGLRGTFAASETQRVGEACGLARDAIESYPRARALVVICDGLPLWTASPSRRGGANVDRELLKTREGYESLCAERGVAPLDDDHCARLQDWDMDVASGSAEQLAVYGLGQMRGTLVRAERREAERASEDAAAPEAGGAEPVGTDRRCRRCGAFASEDALFTTLGGNVYDDCV